MKVVVIGGSGLIGKKLVPVLRQRGHEAVPASPSLGVNALTGEGLAAALAGADVVVDVSNSPSWADDAVMEFFDRSTRNLLAAERVAGVRHHIALSVVAADRNCSIPASATPADSASRPAARSVSACARGDTPDRSPRVTGRAASRSAGLGLMPNSRRSIW